MSALEFRRKVLLSCITRPLHDHPLLRRTVSRHCRVNRLNSAPQLDDHAHRCPKDDRRPFGFYHGYYIPVVRYIRSCHHMILEID